MIWAHFIGGPRDGDECPIVYPSPRLLFPSYGRTAYDALAEEPVHVYEATEAKPTVSGQDTLMTYEYAGCQ